MCLLATILAGVFAQAQSPSTAEPRAEFLAAVRVIQRAESYRATLDPREWFVMPERVPGGGPRTIRLDHARGEPLAVAIDQPSDPQQPGRLGGSLEAWQLGERVVVRDPRGDLRTFDSPLEFDLAALRDRRAPPEMPPAGETPAAPEKTRGDRVPGEVLGRLASRRVAMLSQLAPHTLLAGIEGKIDGEVTRTTTDAITTYHVAWLPEALRSFMPLGGPPAARPVGGAGPVPRAESTAPRTESIAPRAESIAPRAESIAPPQGTLEIDVDAAGSPVAIRVTMHRDSSPAAAEAGASDAPVVPRVRTERKLSIVLDRIGANPAVIPADVRALFPL